jgi:hypothetical protein
LITIPTASLEPYYTSSSGVVSIDEDAVKALRYWYQNNQANVASGSAYIKRFCELSAASVGFVDLLCRVEHLAAHALFVWDGTVLSGSPYVPSSVTADFKAPDVGTTMAIANESPNESSMAADLIHIVPGTWLYVRNVAFENWSSHEGGVHKLSYASKTSFQVVPDSHATVVARLRDHAELKRRIQAQQTRFVQPAHSSSTAAASSAAPSASAAAAAASSSAAYASSTSYASVSAATVGAGIPVPVIQKTTRSVTQHPHMQLFVTPIKSLVSSEVVGVFRLRARVVGHIPSAISDITRVPTYTKRSIIRSDATTSGSMMPNDRSYVYMMKITLADSTGSCDVIVADRDAVCCSDRVNVCVRVRVCVPPQCIVDKCYCHILSCCSAMFVF